MMRSIFTLVCIALALPFLTQAQQSDRIRTYEIADFSKVIVEGHADVHLYPSDKNELRIEARQKDLWDNLEIEEADGLLHIFHHENDGDFDIRDEKFTIQLAYTNLEELEVIGKIWLASESVLEGDRLKIVGEGMIKGDLSVAVEKLLVRMDGLIQVDVFGSAEYATLELYGMGKINGANLTAQHARTKVEGWAKTKIDVRETYEASHEGIGSINFTGSPRKKRISREGISFVRGS
ncbi:MAG: DUF2807 domain-containing protein [Bacteroidota bacterium]